MEARLRPPDNVEVRFDISEMDLTHCRDLLASIDRVRFPVTDLCLALAMLGAGGALGALGSGLAASSAYSWLFFTVLPALAAAALVGYALLKYLGEKEGVAKVKELLHILPDPLKTEGVGGEHSKLAGPWTLASKTSASGKGSSGDLFVHVRQTHVAIAGTITGESGKHLGEIYSRFASYDPTYRRLMFIYGYSAINDNGQLDTSECAFSGLVSGVSPNLVVRGNWIHLTGPSAAGTATLTQREA